MSFTSFYQQHWVLIKLFKVNIAFGIIRGIPCTMWCTAIP